MDLDRLAKALEALSLDMETAPSLNEAEEAWVATRERVHWLAGCAAALAEERSA